MKNQKDLRAATAARALSIYPIGGHPALATQRRCRGCGSNVPLGLKYCTHCGQPLSARATHGAY
jgi:hypothetical protein